MTSRERVQVALHHREPDRVPRDIGASAVTGAHCTVVYALRQALALDPPGTPVKVVEPYQMLGELAPDLLDALKIDIVGLTGPRTLFGYENRDWKEWTFWDGTPLLVPDAFHTVAEPDGTVLMYPEGDHDAPPSGKLPVGGYFFDTIIRQDPIDDERLDPDDNLQEFGPISEADLRHFADEAARVQATTTRAVLANFGGTAFGDIALVPAPFLKRPRGIRDVAEWYMSTRIRRDYVHRVFERQCEIALANLAKVYGVVGDLPDAVFLTGTDFGTQRGTFISPKAYRDLYQPFHREVNAWVHANTKWKTFIHTCGSVVDLLPDFIDAGFDILNPVQCSAAGMDAAVLKERFGDRLTFWGGGVDTQKTLPFGTPDQVRAEVGERLRAFGPGGGFVFNPIHNVQACTPVANVLAMVEALDRMGSYPLA